MTATPAVLDIHPVPHPVAPVRQAGFPLDHPYLEHCWTGAIGPTSVLLLRRCAWLWRDAAPAQVPLENLAAQLGLGKGTARYSAVWHTVERLVRFRFAALAAPDELPPSRPPPSADDDSPQPPSRCAHGVPPISRYRPVPAAANHSTPSTKHPIPRTDPCRFPSGAPAGLAGRWRDAVRFTITPLGASGGRAVGAVVDDIVRYLEPSGCSAGWRYLP